MIDERKWAPVKGYEEAYSISDDGVIRSLSRECIGDNGFFYTKKEKILKQSDSGKGYRRVCLHQNGVRKSAYVHRLVAEAFIPNPSNLPCVNHKDENKTNNHVSNLEWCTVSYNRNYGTAPVRIIRKLSRKVVMKKDGEEIATFRSALEAERLTGIENRYIGLCCKGKKDAAGGYEWEYAEYEKGRV